MNHRRLLPALALATLVAALAACTSPTPRPTPSPPAPPQSASMGEELRPEGWTLTLDSVNFDATADVAGANEFNPEPGADEQYALVALTLTRTGVASTAVGVDVALFIGEQRVVPAPVVAPVPLHLLSEFTSNTPVAGQMVFLVPDGTDAADVLVTVDSSQRFLVPVE